jgi:hypothetical protein
MWLAVVNRENIIIQKYLHDRPISLHFFDFLETLAFNLFLKQIVICRLRAPGLMATTLAVAG